MVYGFAFIDGLCLLSHKLIHLDTMICFAEVVCLGMKAELRWFYGVETFYFHKLLQISVPLPAKLVQTEIKWPLAKLGRCNVPSSCRRAGGYVKLQSS